MSKFEPPRPPRARIHFTSPADILHRSPRPVWGISVSTAVLVLVASVLIILELIGPEAWQLSSWLGINIGGE